MYERDPIVCLQRPDAPEATVTSRDRNRSFAPASATIRAAYLAARNAHGGPGHGDTKLAHPVAVAELLSARGYDEAVLSAALLHDTVEDTPLSIEQIESAFGTEIAGLVADLTEDSRIARYPARKAEARGRAVRDPRVAAIYAADKLANTTRLLEGNRPIDGERLDHYVKTLRLFSEQLPALPFLAELASELTKLIDRDAGRIGRRAG
jgi:(p)ppGpp synthase/HD superfamily hydrolase